MSPVRFIGPQGGGAGFAPRRSLRAGLVALAALLTLWAAAVAAANSRPVLGRLRAGAERAMRLRLGGARLGDRAAVDLLGRLVVGPLVVPAAQPRVEPVLRAERVVIHPRWVALLGGRAEAAALTLSGVRVEAGPGGQEIAALARRLRPPAQPGGRAARPAPAQPLELGFRDVTVAFGAAPAHPGGDGPARERLELGPFAAAVETAEDGLHTSLRLPSGGRVEAVLPRRGGSTGLRMEVEGASLEDLPEALRRNLPLADGGALWARVDSDDVASGAALEMEVRGITLRDERLSREPLGPIRAAFRGTLHWDVRERRAAVEQATLALGPGGDLSLQVSAAASFGGDPTFSLDVRTEGADYAALTRALPASLVPEEAGRLAGPFAARLALSGPARRPAGWELQAALDLRPLRRAAADSDPLGLAGPFRWRPPSQAGSARAILVGPANPDFVPLAELPWHVARAVTTGEDGGFFSHSGFDFGEMRIALAEGSESRRLRGASTITQQLAKNLFLSAERTAARKIREALLTVALEASLPKARLLEIYLNIVEWGPGLHGIGPAARHYFGKDARLLTPREAAFLASAIPNPARYYALCARGEMPESWSERIDGILLKMAAFGQLGEEELRRALQQPLVFARG